jgi:hypothetical protein
LELLMIFVELLALAGTVSKIVLEVLEPDLEPEEEHLESRLAEHFAHQLLEFFQVHQEMLTKKSCLLR